jgi:dCTP deaminase
MGYDIRVTDEYKVFTNVHQRVVDPKRFDPQSFVDLKGTECVIPPNSFALARSVEFFRMPRSIVGICIGKSSYARCGIVVNITPLEPGWEGHLTIEISNTTPLPARIYSHEGIAQVLFFEAGALPEVSYADRKGKYQGQEGITLPKV